MTHWLEEGSPLPSFSLPDETGKPVTVRAGGGPLVIYFYPKDDTPGCTRQACAFRDRSAELSKLGARVIGISGDSAESHTKFRNKYALNFPLLVDSDHQVAERFGAWREKNLYGRKSMGIQRSSFLFDAQGKLAKVWRRVQVAGHDAQVLDAITALRSG
jgi:thioredoxin-dependent peroxiredoxin